MGDRNAGRAAPEPGQMRVIVRTVAAALAARHPETTMENVRRTVHQVAEELVGVAAPSRGVATLTTLVHRRADARLHASTGHLTPILRTRH